MGPDRAFVILIVYCKDLNKKPFLKKYPRKE